MAANAHSTRTSVLPVALGFVGTSTRRHWFCGIVLHQTSLYIATLTIDLGDSLDTSKTGTIVRGAELCESQFLPVKSRPSDSSESHYAAHQVLPAEIGIVTNPRLTVPRTVSITATDLSIKEENTSGLTSRRDRYHPARLCSCRTAPRPTNREPLKQKWLLWPRRALR